MTAWPHLYALALAAVPLFPLLAAEPEAAVDYGLVSALPQQPGAELAAVEPLEPSAQPVEPLPALEPSTEVAAPAAEAEPAQAVAAPEEPAPAPAPAIVANPAITATDPETEAKLANVRVVTVRNLDWRELSAGMPIYEKGGGLIGKVITVAGTDVIVDDGQGQLRVPLVALYGYNVGGVDYVASRVTRAELLRGG